MKVSINDQLLFRIVFVKKKVDDTTVCNRRYRCYRYGKDNDEGNDEKYNDEDNDGCGR